MKQAAAEFFRKEIILNSIQIEDSKGKISFNIGLSKLDKLSLEANEIENQKSDEFAVGFAEWAIAKNMGVNSFKLYEGELEIYKKEKQL